MSELAPHLIPALPFALALIWGIIWALVIQYIPLGQFLARKRTWITVVIGVGVDLLIALLVIDWPSWYKLASIILLSSIGIIIRSLANEYRDIMELLGADQPNETKIGQ